MRLVAFLSFVAFVSMGSSSLLGSSKCTWGPSYWCSQVSRAKECMAVDHCLQEVWTKQKDSTKDGNTQCELCEKMINMVRNILKTKSVDDVVEYIKDLCNVLPFDQTYQTECINMVDDVDTLIKLLQSNITAKGMCGIFMPCNGFEDNSNHHQQPETNAVVQTPLVAATPVKKAGNICTDCVNFMTDIKNLLTAPDTENQLIGMVKQIVCAQLGSVEAICDDLVDTYVPQGLTILSTYVDPQVTCSAAGFCASQDTQELRSKLNDIKSFVMVVLRKMGIHVTTNALECDACKAVTSDIRNMARDPTTQRKVVDFVEQNLCANLGGLADLCKQAVEDNYQAVFQLIAGSLIDDQVCIDLGMCANSLGVTKQLGTIECEACTSVIKALSLLESSTTVQNAIKIFIENDVCPKFGSSAAQCKVDVDMYGTAAFQILKQILNAGYLCGKMTLCAAPVPKVTSNGALCEVCTTAFTELDSLLKDQATQAEVEALLDSICSKLGSNLSAECKTFVDEYAPFVLTMLAQQLDPATICKEIGLCPAKQAVKTTPTKAVSKTIKNDVECGVCEFIVREMANLLKESGTKAEVRQALDTVCSEVSSIKDSCETFLNLYFDLIYSMLVEHADPKAVCTTINLCSAKKNLKPELPKASPRLHVVPLLKGSLPTKIFNLDTPKTSDTCAFCEMVMTYVAEALKQPATGEAIKSVLDMACGKVPQSYQEMCKIFVANYADQIIQWLQKEDDPYMICPKLELCGTKKNVLKDTNLYFNKHIIAEKKCDQGPKYWCSSMSRAQMCGKKEYCLKRNMMNNLV